MCQQSEPGFLGSLQGIADTVWDGARLIVFPEAFISGYQLGYI